ncbi:hypothetical protein EX895_004799 [Sporisorium graminicola]|uniref:Uncharacterized protein n=1 Tax=Sporisorium graminicola TaxID=280036 RepID=A0A4U7KNV3_9BASI|nr:hypothetical protein EX895_004799 [Sporisorium graminicola]TKY85974.1 hypothetical protein EX895_004799 [Sporisorium graminicola]
MLEQEDTIQQNQAGTSRLTREIVPTSDDDDFFFLSQSSGKYGSSLDSAQSSRPSKRIYQNGDDEEDKDEDEDEDEAILPTRLSPSNRQEIQQLNRSRQTLTAEPNRDGIDEEGQTGPETPPQVSTSDLATKRSPLPSQASPERGLFSLSSGAAPVLHPITTPLLFPLDADDTGTFRPVESAPNRPTTTNYDDVEEHRTSQEKDSPAPDSHADATLMPPASQQSEGTLPLAESQTASPNLALTPLLASEGIQTTVSGSPSGASSHPRGEQHPTSEEFSLLDHDVHHYDSVLEAQRQVAPSDSLDRHVNQAPVLSPTPSLPPLRMPTRGAAAETPPSAPNEAPQAESQANNRSIIDDEQLARAAAAQPPTPPRRHLRARKAAQLNPYTLEAVRYQRALIRNDWEDAVVSQREWHRQERKRIAEEAARAQRDVQAVQGSEESQSQWLVPSSGPSSQAEHEASVPSSPAVSSTTQVYVDIPSLDDTGSLRTPTSGSRPWLSSPTPSQSGRLPELAEMIANSSRTASLHPNRSKPGPAIRPATYKGRRTIASTQDNADTQPSRTEEDETPLPPPPARRKHPLRAVSPSDGEGSVGVEEATLLNQDPLIVDSSEDERPSVVPIAKPKRRSRWSGNGSSSDSTDYERRFRQLKKMMPAGMARKHIRDLRAMRHGKAYHSDGHVSSSSADADTNKKTDRRDVDRPRARSTDTADIADHEDLQPGQTRKRLRLHDSVDANNTLLLEPDSDTSSSSSSSTSSSASVSFAHSNMAALHTGVGPEGRQKEADEIDESPAWWSVNRLDSYVPYRERDAIDRMLSRTGGGKPSSKTAVRSFKTVSEHRQARLDGFVSAHPHRERHRESRVNSSRSHLREVDQNQRRQQPTVMEKSVQHGHSHPTKRKKKRPKLDPRVGRTTGSSERGGPVQLRNPPIVRPRARPRLDLEQHDVLFAVNPTMARHARRLAGDDDDFHDENVSDDDGQWQMLSSVVRDSTPVSLPDARLAVPRGRADGGLPRGAPSTATEGDVAPSPVRGALASPSVSSTSARPVRIALNDHSPGTPSRTRWDVHQAKAQVRSNPIQNHTFPLSTTSDPDGSHAWDEFEGISLDFGMVPFAGGKRLDVTGSSLLTQLPDLIALPDRLLGHQQIPRTWSGEVLRLEDTVLDTNMDHDSLANKLPFFIDNLQLTINRMLGEHGDTSDGDARRHARNLVADTGAFLGCWMVRQVQGVEESMTDPALIFRSYRVILERIEQLQASVLSSRQPTRSARAAREDRKSICLQLAWMRFELCWRAMAICDADVNNALEPDAPTVESMLAYSRTLMALLLHHGLHRSVRSLRKAAEGSTSSAGLGMDQGEEQTTVSFDEATAMWLSVIHLLSSFEKSRGITDGRLFWTQFETTYQRWDESMPKRAPLLRAESLWYCLFALSTLSQVSPDGDIQTTPLLREYWPLVARALLFVQFRSEESKEIAMGWHVLAKRDAYVRVVLQRCCLLVSEWRWTMEGAEVSLARLFDIFNSHKLADLPTETEHDFPAFLRDFNVKKLSTADVVDGEAMQDPSFHLFVRLLAQAGQEMREHAVETKEGDRRISRLFSRMTPVRVMPFTRADVPTSSQRSVLFNHYTVVMLFMHLVPTSSPQRLRQIQSFLPAFKDADFVSQVTCIRAMMYVAVIFRHHHLDLDPVLKWFGDAITALRREYEEIESSTKRYERQQLQHSLQNWNVAKPPARPDTVRMADIFENAPTRQAALRRKEEVARLLVIALRSIQHVIRHADLQGEANGTATAGLRLPDQSLLSPAWTQQMLEAQISLEPRVGQEVLKCIQTFLLARIRVLRPEAAEMDSVRAGEKDPQWTVAQQQRDEESQDSFAELFEADDDFDFEDPLLARLLDGADTGTATDSGGAGAGEHGQTDNPHAEKKKWDREFGELVKNTISPSLFQLLSNIYHPDRQMEAAATGGVVMSLGVTQRLNELPIDAHSSHNSAGRALTARTRMDRLLKAAEARQYLELVVDCWAGCAHVLVTNGLREWTSYLGFGNESWKRIDDAVGRRDVGLRFLQNVVSLDPVAVQQRREYEVEFLAVWIQTAVARVLSVQDVYTRSLIETGTDGKSKSSLLSALATQWQAVIGASSASTLSSTTASVEEGIVAAPSSPAPLTLDLDSFTQHRPALLKATYTTLANALTSSTTSIGTAYSLLSALLSSLRAYVEDTPLCSGGGGGVEPAQSSQSVTSSRDYLRFCKTTLADVETTLADTSVMISLRAEFAAVVQVVRARLSGVEAIGEGHGG